MLYIPPYGNLESGDSFCLIEIGGEVDPGEKHPAKQNGIKIIRDCYNMRNPMLRVDHTTIMFMIPVNGKMNTTQAAGHAKEGRRNTGSPAS